MSEQIKQAGQVHEDGSGSKTEPVIIGQGSERGEGEYDVP